MTRSLILLAPCAVLGACQTTAPTDRPAKGLSSVNVPVVSRADYAIDLAAPDGSLASSEAARLDGWFRSMVLGYGDMVYVDGSTGYARATMSPASPANTACCVARRADDRRLRAPGHGPRGRRPDHALRSPAAPTGRRPRPPTSTMRRCPTSAAA